MNVRKRKLLFSRDVAALLGVTVQAARRQMAYWEKVHGAEVVGRMAGPGPRGFARYMTISGLKKIGPDPREEDVSEELARLVERVEVLEAKFARRKV
jgi:hypothetical protein